MLRWCMVLFFFTLPQTPFPFQRTALTPFDKPKVWNHQSFFWYGCLITWPLWLLEQPTTNLHAPSHGASGTIASSPAILKKLQRTGSAIKLPHLLSRCILPWPLEDQKPQPIPLDLQASEISLPEGETCLYFQIWENACQVSLIFPPTWKKATEENSITYSKFSECYPENFLSGIFSNSGLSWAFCLCISESLELGKTRCQASLWTGTLQSLWKIFSA